MNNKQRTKRSPVWIANGSRTMTNTLNNEQSNYQYGYHTAHFLIKLTYDQLSQENQSCLSEKSDCGAPSGRGEPNPIL